MLDIAFCVSQQRRGMMIRNYTEKVLSEDWIIFNDTDVVYGDSGYGSWWSEEYKRRLE